MTDRTMGEEVTTPLHQGVSWVLVFDGWSFDHSRRFDTRHEAETWARGYACGRGIDYFYCVLVYPFAEHDMRYAESIAYPDQVHRAIALTLWGLD